MKKNILFILTATMLLSCGLLKAQDFGIESPITEKNIGVGLKGGLSAMDMAYKMGKKSFVNHTVLYQHPWEVIHCFAGGITVERMPTAIPLIMFVAEPVSDCCAILFTEW